MRQVVKPSSRIALEDVLHPLCYDFHFMDHLFLHEVEAHGDKSHTQQKVDRTENEPVKAKKLNLGTAVGFG